MNKPNPPPPPKRPSDPRAPRLPVAPRRPATSVERLVPADEVPSAPLTRDDASVAGLNMNTLFNNINQEAAVEAPMEEEKKSFLDTYVTNDLLAALESTFGFAEDVFDDIVVTSGKKSLTFTVRRISVDDWTWVTTLMHAFLKDDDESALLSSEVARNQRMIQLAAVRAVVKLEGKWLWEVFKSESVIRELKPSWDGRFESIPMTVKNSLSAQLFDFLRFKLDPQILLELSNMYSEKTGQDQKREDQNPTKAA